MAERSVSVKLLANISQYQAAMASAAAAATGFSAATLSSLDKLGAGMSRVGGTMTRFVSLPLAALGFVAVKSAVDWESSWAGVTKTVDGTAQQLSALEGELRSMASELPASHAEIAKVAEAAGQLGVAAPDVAAFTRVMVDLGETTNLSSDEAATSIAQLMNVMKTAPSQVSNLGSALVALGNDGASTERDIVQMAQRMAGAAEIIGLSEAEVLGFANAVASTGIEVEAGGSSMQRVFIDMGKAVATGSSELGLFAKTAGVSAQQFATAFREDPASAIVSFIEGLGRLHAAGGDVFTVLENLGFSDVRVSRSLLSMATNVDVLKGSLDLGATAWEENSALSEEAAKRYETTAAKLGILRNQFVDVFISLSNIALPVLEGVMSGVQGMVGAFDALPQPVQIAALAFLGLVAAVGPILKIGGALIQNLGSIAAGAKLAGDALQNVAARGMAANLTALATGVGLLALAFIPLAIHQRRAAEASKEAADALDEVSRASDATLITKFVAAWREGAESFKSSARPFEEALKAIAEQQPGVIARMLEMEAASGAVSAAWLAQGVGADGVAERLRMMSEALAAEVVAQENATVTAEAADEAIGGVGAAAGEAAVEAGELASVGSILAATMRDIAEQAQAEANALKAQRDAARESADATYGLHGAQQAMREAVAEANEKLKNNNLILLDTKRSADEHTTAMYDSQAALDEVAQAAQNVADEEVNLARQTALAQGAAFSHEDAVKAENASLVAQVSQMNGPTREAVLAHIFRLNGIPETEQTDIIAAINEGRLADAEAALSTRGGVARPRNVDVSAVPHSEHADRVFSNMGPYRVSVFANPITSMIFRAGGGRVQRGENFTMVGEEGPELVSLPAGSMVHTASQTKGMVGSLTPAPAFSGGGSASGAPSSGGIHIGKIVAADWREAMRTFELKEWQARVRPSPRTVGALP